MQITQIKEDISISYISALCAYAGIAYEIVRHDEDSTDGILKKRVLLDGVSIGQNSQGKPNHPMKGL